MGIDLKISQERLKRLIGRFATTALESRQVAKRLRSLLPLRFRSVKRQLGRHHRGGRADRLALVDQRYRHHLEELVHINHQARQARVQYETHKMLFQARQSQRVWQRGSRHRPAPAPPIGKPQA